MLSDRTVHDNLAFVLKATGWKGKEEIEKRIEEVLVKVGLERKGYKMPHQLSGGEQQMLAMGRALMTEPNVLLLDEPTNHLDLEAIIALGEGLRDFKGNVICTSHDRELLDAFADRIIALQSDGTFIDFKGSYEEFAEAHGH